MKRVIVDYAKLTNEILTLLVEKFPDGYDDTDIIRFKNAKNETVEAVEVRTEDTTYLVKVSTKLADRIENFDEDDDELVDVDDMPAGDLEIPPKVKSSKSKKLKVEDDMGDDDDFDDDFDDDDEF